VLKATHYSEAAGRALADPDAAVVRRPRRIPGDITIQAPRAAPRGPREAVGLWWSLRLRDRHQEGGKPWLSNAQRRVRLRRTGQARPEEPSKDSIASRTTGVRFSVTAHKGMHAPVTAAPRT
jgi:hypothetical protein